MDATKRHSIFVDDKPITMFNLKLGQENVLNRGLTNEYKNFEKYGYNKEKFEADLEEFNETLKKCKLSEKSSGLLSSFLKNIFLKISRLEKNMFKNIKPNEYQFNYANTLNRILGIYFNTSMGQHTKYSDKIFYTYFDKKVMELEEKVEYLKSNASKYNSFSKDVKEAEKKLEDAKYIADNTLNAYDNLRKDLVDFYVDAMTKYEKEINGDVFNEFIDNLNKKYASIFSGRDETLNFNNYLSKIAFPNIKELTAYNSVIGMYNTYDFTTLMDIACMVKFSEMLPKFLVTDDIKRKVWDFATDILVRMDYSSIKEKIKKCANECLKPEYRNFARENSRENLITSTLMLRYAVEESYVYSADLFALIDRTKKAYYEYYNEMPSKIKIPNDSIINRMFQVKNDMCDFKIRLNPEFKKRLDIMLEHIDKVLANERKDVFQDDLTI